MNEKAIGRNIKQILTRKGMTQADLAEKVGTTTVSVSRYITGSRIPKATMLQAIANALECDVGMLLIGCQDGEIEIRDMLKARVIIGMDTKGYIINDKTDGLIPVDVELVAANGMFNVRMPGQSVTISLYAKDVSSAIEREGKE